MGTFVEARMGRMFLHGINHTAVKVKRPFNVHIQSHTKVQRRVFYMFNQFLLNEGLKIKKHIQKPFQDRAFIYVLFKKV